MKRILVPIILSCLFGCQLKAQTTECKILSRTDGSITFEVDENLPAPKKTEIDKYRVHPGSEIAQSILSRYEIPKGKEGIIATSFQDEKITSEGPDVLFQAMLNAYANHRPLVLSPDMIWLVISQGFSHYVNEHAEELRDKLVSHDGKVDLVVQSGQDLLTNKNVDWDGIFNQFEQQIKDNTKGDVASMMTANFSTTGPTERIASQITLMDAVNQYFEFIVMYLGCGIPNITLQGTAEDWQKVLDKTRMLSQYGLEWWTKDLETILTEFVNTAKGHPEKHFWQNIVMQKRPDELRGGACDMRPATRLTGWFLILFPFKKDGLLTDYNVKNGDELMSEMVRVKFRYLIVDEHGKVTTEQPMELYAGFIGIEPDRKDMAVVPKIGWIVRKAENTDAAQEKLKNMATGDKEIDIRVREVPEALKGAEHLQSLTIRFADKVVVPLWMDHIKIDRFTIYGEMTDDEKATLKQRFPKMEIKREKHYRDSVVKFIK